MTVVLYVVDGFIFYFLAHLSIKLQGQVEELYSRTSISWVT